MYVKPKSRGDMSRIIATAIILFWTLSAVLYCRAEAATFNLFSPATGILKGMTSTYVTTSASVSDVVALFSGTCSSSTVLKGDGTCGVGTLSSVPTTVQGDILYASGTNTLSALAKNTSATRYLSNTGTSNNPAWAQVALATGVSGTLPVANGGTGATSLGTLSKADDTNVTLTLGGTPAGALINSTSITAGWTGTLAASRGGLGMSTVTDDTIAVANGTTWESKALPNCTDTGGNHINYTTSSNTWSCGTSGATTFANPAASIGLTAVNGSATTAMRSDAAPALSQAIVPTWSGVHTFNAQPVISTGATARTAIFDSTAGGFIGIRSSGSEITELGTASSIITGGSASNAALNSTGGIDLATSSVARLNIANAGNVTVNTPGSGTALTVAGASGGITPVRWTDSAGTTIGFLGASSTPSVDIGSVSNHPLNLYSNSTARVAINAAGNVTINAPSSGTALTVNATSASTAGIDLASGHLKIGGSAGTAGQVLTSGGSGAAPSWTTGGCSTGSFTATLTGMTTTVTGTVNYRVCSNIAYLWATSSLTGTSNTSTMSMTGLPAAVTPANSHYAFSTITDNGITPIGGGIVSSSSQILFHSCSAALGCTSSQFTSTGTKGVGSNWTYIYPLD